MFGAWEIIVILLVVLLLFGGKKLPELARSLGQGIREFKKASQDISEEINSSPEDASINKDSTVEIQPKKPTE